MTPSPVSRRRPLVRPLSAPVTTHSAIPADHGTLPGWTGAAFAALLLLVAELSRFLRLVRLPTDQLVGHIPDDAFYYLILGRNFTHLHRWTFDGVAPATGFHLLWGYGVAAMYLLFPGIGLRSTFTLLFWLSALLVAAALFLLCRLVARHFGSFAIVGPTAVFFGLFALGVPNWLMETPLVLLSAAAVVSLVGTGLPTRGRLLAAFAAGMLGMLSRSDFGLLPLLLFAGTLLFRASSWRLAAPALLGSTLGLGLLLAHTELVSGHLVQGSAQAKRHWSALEHDNPRYSIIHLMLPTYTDPAAPMASKRATEDVLRLAIFALAALGCAAFAAPHRRQALALTLALSLVPVGYMALYTFDCSSLQPWYFSNVLIPFGFLAGALCSPRLLAWRVLVVVLAVAWAANGLRRSMHPIWQPQAGMFAAGQYIAQHPELQPVASWNSGVMRFFGGPLINIDGLVNDNADPFILSGHLPAYLAQRHIRALVDDPSMFTPLLKDRGGYPGTSLTGCITAQTPIYTNNNTIGTGSHIVLSLLDPACLQTR